MITLTWVAIILLSLAYVKGLHGWIYQGKLLHGLGAIFIPFPAIIHLAVSYASIFFSALPIAGILMFFHRYGWKTLYGVRLLWFTTLSMIIILLYYANPGIFHW